MTLNLLRLLAALALAASVLACASRSLVAQSYPITDSRHAAGSENIYWVDDQRVLFQGFGDRRALRPDGVEININKIYLWDVKSGAVVDRGEIGGGLCFSGGYVRYWRWTKDGPGRVVEWMAGKLGHEVPVEQSVTDPETCRSRNDSPLPDWTAGKKVLRLRQEHGFLVLGPERPERNTPVTYHPKGLSDGILMPFKRREAWLSFIKYVPFENAYFIVGDYFVADPRNPLGGYNKSPWPKDVPIPVWWLYPDGRLKEIKLPTDSRDGSWTFPARGGIYYVSHRYPDAAGLFKVLDGSKVRQMVRGSIQGYVVSRDGCKIAMNHDENYAGKRGQGTVKAVDVCKKGE